VVRITNTLRLDAFWISEALVAEANRDGSISVTEAPAPLAFDDEGNLPELSATYARPTAATVSDADAW
jgi:hypothetical protein